MSTRILLSPLLAVLLSSMAAWAQQLADPSAQTPGHRLEHNYVLSRNGSFALSWQQKPDVEPVPPDSATADKLRAKLLDLRGETPSETQFQLPTASLETCLLSDEGVLIFTRQDKRLTLFNCLTVAEIASFDLALPASTLLHLDSKQKLLHYSDHSGRINRVDIASGHCRQLEQELHESDLFRIDRTGKLALYFPGLSQNGQSGRLMSFGAHGFWPKHAFPGTAAVSGTVMIPYNRKRVPFTSGSMTQVLLCDHDAEHDVTAALIDQFSLANTNAIACWKGHELLELQRVASPQYPLLLLVVRGRLFFLANYMEEAKDRSRARLLSYTVDDSAGVNLARTIEFDFNGKAAVYNPMLERIHAVDDTMAVHLITLGPN